MNRNRRRPLRNLAVVGIALLALAASAAVSPTEWRHRQALTVEAPGVVRVELNEATFDAARPDQADLRVLDAAGREVAFLLDRPSALTPRLALPASFAARLESGATVLMLKTGTATPLVSVALETPAPFFLRGARVEISDNGETWSTLDQGVPVFRQWGAEQLHLDLGSRPVAWVRVTIENRREAPLPFTGARLALAGEAAPAPRDVATRIAARDEYAGETVLMLTAPARNLPLAGITFETPEPLFTRRVTIAVREADGETTRERVVGSGTIYRVALAGAAPRARLAVDFDHAPLAAELLVHIHNGDSPPLQLEWVALKQHPTAVLFPAPVAGTYTLLSGNPQARAPQYDFAAFTTELRTANAQTITPGERIENPDYRAREPLVAPALSEIPLVGAALDTTKWTRQQTVALAAPGVQECELDPAALAGARTDLADLRLLRAGHQIPYLLERTALARALPLALQAAPDQQRPAVSRWEIKLPHAGLPLRRLTLATQVALFHRDFRLYERTAATSGQGYERTLATGSWSRTPDDGSAPTHALELTERPTGNVLILETNNGENAPLVLTQAVGAYPVTRLIFKSQETDGLFLLYGQPAAQAPRYDLGLVASTLLTAPRHPARLAEAQDRTASGFASFAKSLQGGAIFWTALALVVVILLVVVARLLPKADAPRP